MFQYRYILASVIRLVGLPVAKDAFIRRSRFDDGVEHQTSGFEFSNDKASPEIAEADLSRPVLKRPRPARPPNRAPTLGFL